MRFPSPFVLSPEGRGFEPSLRARKRKEVRGEATRKSYMRNRDKFRNVRTESSGFFYLVHFVLENSLENDLEDESKRGRKCA